MTLCGMSCVEHVLAVTSFLYKVVRVVTCRRVRLLMLMGVIVFALLYFFVGYLGRGAVVGRGCGPCRAWCASVVSMSTGCPASSLCLVHCVWLAMLRFAGS